MTLDEAIEMYTSNAEYERTHGNLQGCLEFKQLADWLKDYKRLLAQEPKTGKWIEERTYMECPNCHDIWHYEENQTERFKVCPTCGE